MNTFTVVVFFAAVAAASAGLLGAPLAAPLAAPVGLGQISSQTTALNSGTYKARFSQSARPVAFAAAAPAIAAPAIAHPVAPLAAAPAIAAAPLAAPIAAPAVSAGHVVTAYGYTPLAQTLLG